MTVTALANVTCHAQSRVGVAQIDARLGRVTLPQVCVEGPKEKLDTTAVSQVRSKTNSGVRVYRCCYLVCRGALPSLLGHLHCR
jgi:hypothetical protein